MKNSEIAPRLALARKVAVKAGAHQLNELARLKPGDVRTKSKNNFVTHVDLASEKIILNGIQKAFPADAILSEEAGALPGSGFSWIIDPLDGTSNFIHQIPFFGVSIGIALNGLMQAGVLYVPCHKELFWAKRSGGAYLGSKRIHVSTRSRLNESLIGTAIPYKCLHARWNEYQGILNRVSHAGADIRRTGAMAIDLAYLACGRLDGLWAFDQAPWDLAAGELLVQEAGGVITVPEPARHPQDRLCANPSLLRHLTQALKKNSK